MKGMQRGNNRKRNNKTPISPKLETLTTISTKVVSVYVVEKVLKDTWADISITLGCCSGSFVVSCLLTKRHKPHIHIFEVR